MTYNLYINDAKRRLLDHGFDPSIIYSLIYKFNPLIQSLVDLTSFLNDNVDNNINQKLDNALNDLINKKKPLAYILDYVWFLGAKFYINNHVLIPRLETEQWTDKLINILDQYPEMKILDLCCGSGVIGLSIKKQLPRMELHLSDISKYAIEITKKNAKQFNLNVNVIESDLFSNLGTIKFDLIVCNPPYISLTDHVDESVSVYEPHLALFAKDNGLFFYEKILKSISNYLNKKYLVIFEIDYNQSKDVVSLIKKYLDANIEIWKDQFNHERAIFIKVN